MAGIVVVDECPMATMPLVHVLERHGHEVRVCTSVEDTLRELENSQPDLLITELVLPPGPYGVAATQQGLVTGRYLAAEVHERWPEVKLVFFTTQPRGLFGPPEPEYIERRFDKMLSISVLADQIDALFS